MYEMRSAGDVRVACVAEDFFVYSYSHATYIDHGGVHFAQFSCPQSARRRLVASSPMPSAQACPNKVKTHQRNHKGNRVAEREWQTKESVKRKRSPSPPTPLRMS